MKKLILIIISITAVCQLAFAYTNNFNTTREDCYNTMMINDYQNKTWNDENVDELLHSLGFFKTIARSRRYDDNKNAVIKTMQYYQLPFPSNLSQFIYQVFDNINTNQEVAHNMFNFTMFVTNSNVGYAFLDILTNNWNAEYKLPGWRCEISFRSKCDVAISAIGTPQIIENLNQAVGKLHKAGITWNKPAYTIDPSKHPEVALDWIFHHPNKLIRKRLIARWRDSDRPEATEVLREYIARLENLPKMDPFFTEGVGKEEWPWEKKIQIEEVSRFTDKIEKRRNNWLKDEMCLPVNNGWYSPKSFKSYQKKKEKRLKEEAKEKEDWILMYETEYSKAREIREENYKKRKDGKTSIPVPQPKSKEEVEAMKKQIKVWQKEGFKGIKKTKPPVYKFWKFL